MGGVQVVAAIVIVVGIIAILVWGIDRIRRSGQRDAAQGLSRGADAPLCGVCLSPPLRVVPRSPDE